MGSLVFTVGCTAEQGTSDEQTTASSSDQRGARPPWRKVDSAMDIGVENQLNSELQATVEVEDFRKEVAVRPGSTWVSENVIESGVTPTVRLTTDNSRQKEVTWKGESESETYLMFKVASERITYQMLEKGTITRTQITDTPENDDRS